MHVRAVALIAPILLVLVFTFLGEVLRTQVRGAAQPLLYAASGVTGAVVIHRVTAWAASRTLVAPPRWGTAPHALLGLLIGVVVSVAAALLFWWTRAPELDLGAMRNRLLERLTANVGPAALEEAGFRGGLVHLLTAFFGPAAGLVGGSVPFGLAHLFGLLLGRHVGAGIVIGTGAAGLLLSLVYVRFGLIAAFAAHLSWNVLAGSWAQAFGMQRGGIEALEGAWTTSLVLLAAAILLFLTGR
jgi:membrane protease YdiL (CAAX protease family)